MGKPEQKRARTIARLQSRLDEIGEGAGTLALFDRRDVETALRVVHILGSAMADLAEADDGVCRDCDALTGEGEAHDESCAFHALDLIPDPHTDT